MFPPKPTPYLASNCTRIAEACQLQNIGLGRRSRWPSRVEHENPCVASIGIAKSCKNYIGTVSSIPEYVSSWELSQALAILLYKHENVHSYSERLWWCDPFRLGLLWKS